ncbi:MAG: transporter substrate-binding domain-containing protein [Oligoflexia bacterium]|nr:transporter substrate-binding domain-containing protein [Oligoflexia bacterium]
MKVMRVMKVILGLFIFILIAMGQVLHAADVVINVAYEDKEQPPYYMGNDSTVLAKNPGSVVEIVALLAKKIPGVTIKFTRYPWPRCLSELENGAADAIFNSSYKKEREKNGLYPMKDGKVDDSKRLTNIAYNL